MGLLSKIYPSSSPPVANKGEPLCGLALFCNCADCKLFVYKSPLVKIIAFFGFAIEILQSVRGKLFQPASLSQKRFS